MLDSDMNPSRVQMSVTSFLMKSQLVPRVHFQGMRRNSHQNSRHWECGVKGGWTPEIHHPYYHFDLSTELKGFLPHLALLGFVLLGWKQLDFDVDLYLCLGISSTCV